MNPSEYDGIEDDWAAAMERDEPEFDGEGDCPFCEGEGCHECDFTGEYDR